MLGSCSDRLLVVCAALGKRYSGLVEFESMKARQEGNSGVWCPGGESALLKTVSHLNAENVAMCVNQSVIVLKLEGGRRVWRTELGVWNLLLSIMSARSLIRCMSLVG